MIILGLYAGHDANWCILKDGQVLRHVEAERTSRKKHQRGFHRASMERMFQAAGVRPEEVDLVAVGGSLVGPSSDPWPELTAGVEAVVRDSVRPIHDFAEAVQTGSPSGWMTGFADVCGKQVPVFVVHHHLSHASLAYFTSPYPDCLTMSWDGGGDGAYLAYVRGKGGKITEVVYNPPARKLGLSIGAPWSVLPLLYPFPEVACADAADKYLLDLEGKVMGHAAYGKPRPEWVDLVKRYAREFRGHSALLERARADLSGKVDFSDFLAGSLMDLSASLQAATEDLMMEVLAEVSQPGEALALTGGCAYNCVANGKIFEVYPKIYVPSCPHDGGLAMGAALFVWHHVLGNEFQGVLEQTPYLGVGEFQATEKDATRAAEDIAAGKIVAWFDGPAESGKRALGARSILLDPRRSDGKEYMNERVKKREWFRPYAPSVLPYSGDWGDMCDGNTPPSNYMSFSMCLKEAWRGDVPSVVHVDGTCRPQTVTGKNNSAYAALIDAFHVLSGFPMVLNTSFNLQEPIVDTPEDARRTFEAAPIDVLYLNGERIAK